MTTTRAENLLWAILVVALAAASTLQQSFAIGIVLAATGVGIWRWPTESLHAGVIAVLVLRPSLDLFSERRLGSGPFGSSPAVVCGLAVLLVALVLGLARWEQGSRLWPDLRLWRIHRWLVMATFIGLYSGIRVYGSAGAGPAVREVLRVSSVLAAFLLVLWWVADRPQRYRTGWIYLVLGALPPVAVALWQYLTRSGNLEISGVNRLQGTFSHPNSLGPYLIPFILVLVGSLLIGGVGTRVVRFVLASALTLLLVQTFSRTSLLTLLMGLLIFPLLQVRGLGVRAMLRALGLVALLAVLGWVVMGEAIRDRFADLFVGGSLTELAISSTQENSLYWRLLNWGGLVNLGLQHPWMGHGAGMTTILNPNVAYATGIPYSAHNDFVRVFFEAGVLGLICYLMYGVFLARWALGQARHASPATGSTGFAIAGAVIALFFLSGGTPEFGLQTAIQYEIYGMLALMTVAHTVEVPVPGSRQRPVPAFGPSGPDPSAG